MRPVFWLLALLAALALGTFLWLTTTFSKPEVVRITLPAHPKDADEQEVVSSANDLTILLNEPQFYYYSGSNKPDSVPVLRTANSVKALGGVLQAWPKRHEGVAHVRPIKHISFSQMTQVLDELEKAHQPRYALENLTDDDKRLLAIRPQP